MKFSKTAVTLSLAASVVLGGLAAPAAALQVPTASTISVTASNVQINSANITISQAKKKVIKKVTTSALNLRKGAGTKHKRITTLKKNTTVTVLKSKSGWSQVKAGSKTGWVSSKYLKNVPKAAPKKVTPKKKAAPKKKAVVKKISIKSVKTYGDAQKYLKQSCPRVKIKKISGRVSHYNPNTRTIAIAQAHTKSYRMGFVFSHELSHHYQWMGHYKNNVGQWNKDVKNKKIEKQADQMAYYSYGGVGQGVYNKKKASGTALKNAKNMINKGKKAGC